MISLTHTEQLSSQLWVSSKKAYASKSCQYLHKPFGLKPNSRVSKQTWNLPYSHCHVPRDRDQFVSVFSRAYSFVYRDRTTPAVLLRTPFSLFQKTGGMKCRDIASRWQRILRCWWSLTLPQPWSKSGVSWGNIGGIFGIWVISWASHQQNALLTLLYQCPRRYSRKTRKL